MIWRLGLLAVAAWAIGFVVFANSLGKPVDLRKTDAIVVLTGAPGRIDRGIELLRKGSSRHLLVSGVDRQVKRKEFAAEYKIEPKLMECCIELGRAAVDTQSNGEETAAWVRKHDYRTVRLVTSDAHMPRARLELAHALGHDVTLIGDPVMSAKPMLGRLFVEYHKYLLRAAATAIGID